MSDPYFKALSSGKLDMYWNAHSKNKPNGAAFYSTEFKDLCQKILSVDPKHRPSI
jgi:hypothetical protein